MSFMKKITALYMGISLSLFSSAQQDSMKEKNLDEVIIYSSKFAERKKNVVQKIEVITSRQIAQMNAQNTGDLLINTGNVFVQKSQQGGSSPVIRGFEASRVLLVVDGIRMNNAIYRSGHLQNVITVDPNMLDRVEVLYGPASTLYGSDALGGVVLMRSKTPKLSQDKKKIWTGTAFTRYSNANNEKTGHFDLSIGGAKFGWLQSYNYSDFDDARMGDHYPDAYPHYGRRTQYITTINGIDSVVTNKDNRIQKFSGFQQWDITQKILFKQSENISHLLNVQYSGSSNIHRYDRLQDTRNGLLRYAEWYYGPQTRQLVAYDLNIDGLAFFTNFKTNLSYQHIEESRHQREYRRYDRLDNRLENLHVINVLADARKLWEKNELTVGIDAQFNDIKSTAFRKNILTGAISPLDSRYPNGKNRMNYYGIYGQHTYKFGNGKWVLNDGMRLQTVFLNSNVADNSFFNFPFTRIKQENKAVTGNLGLIYMPNTGARFTAGLSSGFRAPNVDDASRIFESGNNQLVVPNAGIKPEYTYNADLGFSKTLGEVFQVEATGFYTLFRNAVALSAFQLNGQDSVNYNGSRVKVVSNQNENKAHLYGVNAGFTLKPSASFSLISTFNYTKGQYEIHPDKLTTLFIRRTDGSYIDSAVRAKKKPMDHIPPLYGKFSFKYIKNKVEFDAYVLFNGWKRIQDFNPDGEDNPQYAAPNGYLAGQIIPDGYPAWLSLNLKTTVSVKKSFSIQAGIENIMDRNYRYFASGFSAPGRNIMVALRSNF